MRIRGSLRSGSKTSTHTEAAPRRSRSRNSLGAAGTPGGAPAQAPGPVVFGGGTALAGLAVSILVSVYQGALTAMLGVPSFVVTLGGLMSFRGAAFLVADGKTQPVNDAFFQRLGGGFGGKQDRPSFLAAQAAVAAHRAGVPVHLHEGP